MKIVDYSIFKERRKNIINKLKEQNPSFLNGVLILFADPENLKYHFKQDSSFNYLTGLEEPGIVLCSYFDGREVLYIPNYAKDRGQWVGKNDIVLIEDGSEVQREAIRRFQVDEVKPLGNECAGYSLGKFFVADEHKTLIKDLDEYLGKSALVCGFKNENKSEYFMQVYRLQKVLSKISVSDYELSDISSIVHQMRRTKTQEEIDFIKRAADITVLTHKYVSRFVRPGFHEYELEAMIEYAFIQNGATGTAFPSIIASGPNAATLHYTGRSRKLENGDLVVIDIGAEYKNYCADVTRTYPVSGEFSARQQELYMAVLETQLYVENLVKPGMFLNNLKEQNSSLHHLATKQLSKTGLDKYFIHGIGHFLGLDVHDVGNHEDILKVGDVITIEPGVYISQEGLGIRIEDDYLITSDGCECLSKALCKHIPDIETLIKRS